MNCSEVPSWLYGYQRYVKTSKENRDLLETGGIDNVASSFPEGVEELEAHLLVHFTHTNLGPGGLSNAHPTELEGRDMDTSALGELTEVTETGLGGFGGDEAGHCCFRKS
jgi:hypothetical protein